MPNKKTNTKSKGRLKHRLSNRSLKKPGFSKRELLLVALVFAFLGAYVLISTQALTPGGQATTATTAATPSATAPCPGNPPPAQWRHVVVLMFENESYDQVIGPSMTSTAPFINGLVAKCGTAYSGIWDSAPKNNWHDADFKVDGSSDGDYNSKPSYATLTDGVPPSVSGIDDDTYSTVTSVDNIYNQMRIAGKSVKDYYDGGATNIPCPDGPGGFSGDYHDPIRYFSNIGGQSSDPTTFCNTHDKPLSTFMTDLNSGNLPAFSMILPTNDENMHDSTIPFADTWAQNFLTPVLNSTQYQSGDTAIFFLWDEDTPIPNVLLAPSIQPGSKVPVPAGNPISHFAGLRTFEEMLGLPFIGNTAQAPSLLSFFNGGGTPPPADTTPPTVSLTAPVNGANLTGSVTVSANASDNVAVTGVQFKFNGSALQSEDTTAPYSISWDTTTVANGTYTLTATARDAAGNSTTSSGVSVTVNNTGPPPTCPNGDVNGDCHVTITDLSVLLSNWSSTTNAACDLNHNGTVDIFDLSILLSNYGK
jgi:hypothetical protein